MAKQIEDDFCDDIPVFIGVLNGSFMVVADLLKYLSKSMEIITFCRYTDVWSKKVKFYETIILHWFLKVGEGYPFG